MFYNSINQVLKSCFMAPFPEVGCEFHIVKDPFKMNVTPAKISNYAICNAYALYSVK